MTVLVTAPTQVIVPVLPTKLVTTRSVPSLEPLLNSSCAPSTVSVAVVNRWVSTNVVVLPLPVAVSAL